LKNGNALPARPFAWLFFGSFIVVAVFVVINPFIAVVINNLERAKAAEELARDSTSPHRELLARLEVLKDEIARCERGLRGGT